MKQRNKLMIPGPVPVWEETLDALGEQVMSNYTEEFIPIYRKTMDFLHQVFQTQHDISCSPHPAQARSRLASPACLTVAKRLRR